MISRAYYSRIQCNSSSKGAIVRAIMRMLCAVFLIQTCSLAQDSTEFKSIHAAAAEGNARGILLYIQEGVSVNAKDSKGRTPLMSASESGMSRVLPILLDRKAEINAVDRDGNTALHLGASKGHVKVISELIRKGADESIKNGKGLTAKELASTSGNARAANEFRSDVQSGEQSYRPYDGVSDSTYQTPVVASDRLKEALEDPNAVRARLLSDPKLVNELKVLFRAMEAEEARWTSKTRHIKNTFLSSLRKEIDSEILFVQKVARAKDANDIVHDLDVIQSTWKSIFSQSSRKMRDAARAGTAQAAQSTMRPSRSRARRPSRTRSGEIVSEVNPHASYIDSWSSTSDTGLDAIYQATEVKFLEDMSRVRISAEKQNETRIINAIDGVMLERKLRAERSLVVYGLTKADLAAVPDTGVYDENGRTGRSRRGNTQGTQTGRRRR